MAATATIACGSEADVDAVAARLALALGAGDAVLLEGAIGAGKTHFVRALATVLGSTDNVTSPTYTLMHVYETASGQVLHLDAYRLSGLAEYRDLGIEDLAPEAITLVEWGDKVAGAHPGHLRIEFVHDPACETARILKVSSDSDRWAAVVEALA